MVKVTLINFCLLLFVILLFYPTAVRIFAQSEPEESALSVTVRPDNSVNIQLRDSTEFMSDHPFITAYVGQKSCLPQIPTDEVTSQIITESVCKDSAMQVSLTQPGEYDINPPNDSLLVVGNCTHAENNCQEHPELFTTLSVTEISWTGDQTDSSEATITVTEVKND